jgi:hypothetical protein
MIARPLRPLLLLLALVASLLAFRLGAVPLIGPDEPRYARVAVEMSRSGDLVTPTLQGQPWLEKPALYYWLAAGAYRLLGETELAARLPSLLAALVMVAGTVAVGSRIYGPAAGLHAGFVLGTSVLTFAYGRAASMDMLLAATVTLAIGLATLRALQRAGPGAMVAAWGFAALATLAKGPLGLLLPLLVIGSVVAFLGGRRFAREVLSLRGVLLFSAVALPWYTLVLLRERWTFVEVFLLNHNVQRFTSTVHNHPGTIAYYVPILLIGLAPWSGLLLPAVLRLRPRASLADRALLLWFLLPLVFFSGAGSKLPGYILPCLPPLAILMGREADRLVRGDPPGLLGSGGRAVAILGLIVASASPTCSRGDSLPTRPEPSRCSGWAPPASCCSRLWRSRICSRGASPGATSSAPPLAGRSSPGARGARRGWPATSTTTAESAKSRAGARSSASSSTGQLWCSAARASGDGSKARRASASERSRGGREGTCSSRSASGGTRVRQPLHQPDHGAPPERKAVSHLVHEGPHEEDPSPEGLEQVLLRQRIGKMVGVEAHALVGHLDLEAVRLEQELDGDALGLVEQVAMLDRVDHRLPHRDAHVVRRFLVEAHHPGHVGQHDLDQVEHVEAT